ncbi:patatin-like phospholipase family protein [Lentzea flaviverrucosa]|uniref:Predicted phospholipase, patatin/cPLA2 family n=1 Tax=Lentzea flaviverrucosa TaxID=200379 RepID=A0A1H9XXD3_9PSEU|nr:patatin-like phospholipase family protein [Lentzea flaviverrucosa]RDI17080.1 putative patatin/cPLA2 family phospholipase [Lentzea flaviverrucosa]SES50848.1 Predicted phospholipase, patatin/cPLA2 family [Lentzea flaviverrucosa]
MTVLELLRERKQHQSVPGQRNDDARLVLLVEGGSSRGVYSSGMTVAIERLGLLPLFDAVYGSSAGSLNAAWLLCGRADSSKHAWWDPAVMRATINPRRAFTRRPVVDTHHLVHTVYTQVHPMGFQEILDSPVEFHPMTTDGLTGDAVDLHGYVRDQLSLQTALRASAAMPFLAGDPVRIDGRPYVDAGLSETIPVGTAISQGATHVVALRTRREDEFLGVPPSRGERFVLSRWFARHAPGVVANWLRREEIRAKDEELLATHPACLQIRPPLGSAVIGRTERRRRVMQDALDVGVEAAMSHLGNGHL